jgi:hypothetical protein
MKLERVFYTIWSVLGLIALFICIWILHEWLDHGASWDGVFNAILKHINKACTDVKPVYISICKLGN